jgi:hypothetical protein
MSRKQRSEEDLLKASKHLRYEYRMFIEIANTLSARRFKDDTIIKPALLESFTIHTRNLLYFLYSKNPREDDVIAEDFLDDQEIWRSKRPKKSDVLENIHCRVGKEVAHLTYARYDVIFEAEAKPWSISEIASEVDQIFRKFIQLVPPRRLSPEMKSAIKSHQLTVFSEPNTSVTTSAITEFNYFKKVR